MRVEVKRTNGHTKVYDNGAKVKVSAGDHLVVQDENGTGIAILRAGTWYDVEVISESGDDEPKQDS